MNRLSSFALAAFFVPALAAQSAPRGWDFEITPYLMFTNIEGDASVGRLGQAPVDVDFRDIMRNLEFGGMVHAEAHHGRSGMGVILDYGFMELGADRAGAFGAVLDADVRQGVLEAFVSHRSRLAGGATVDTYAGVRWWDIDLDVSLSPGPLRRSRNVDWVDPVFGMKINSPIHDDWDVLLRVDYGGYGISSDFTWTTAVGVRHDITRSASLELQYKILSVDYDEDRGTAGFFSYDTVTHGPLLGLVVRF